MRILLWHVHGSWTTAFVQGSHEYVLPLLPDRGPDGLGRARTWDWPASVREVPVDQLRDEPFDLVVLQRPHEAELVRRWTGRQPGADLAAVYVEHNTPDVHPCTQRHPVADCPTIPIAHVTHFNRLMWDTGRARTVVIEHGIVDPGDRYTGDIEAAAVVLNDPLRRGRIVGADLIPRFACAAPIDLFGMRVTDFVAESGLDLRNIQAYEDLPQEAMHSELPRRRVYVHPTRWTSLGLALIEAMHLAMPVVVLASTEAVEAVPVGAGVLSTDVEVLTNGIRRFMADPDDARAVGKAARTAALERYGLQRFLADWDRLLSESAAGQPNR